MNQIAYWIATCLGVGKIPFAPGTWGSLVAIPFVLMGVQYGSGYYVLTAILVLCAIWSSHIVARTHALQDPSFVVIDEFVGIFITFLFIPIRWQTLSVGFVLFRLFDILKPPPIRYVEHFSGGFGIVCDDVVAALFANLILQALVRYAYL
jgi:phosphatidylglycerophosphatase A